MVHAWYPDFSTASVGWCQDTLLAVFHLLNHFSPKLKSHVMSLLHQPMPKLATHMPCMFVFFHPIIDFALLMGGLTEQELHYRYWFHLIGPWAGWKGSEYEVVNSGWTDPFADKGGDSQFINGFIFLSFCRSYHVFQYNETGVKCASFLYLVVPLPVISRPRRLQHFGVCFNVCVGSRSAQRKHCTQWRFFFFFWGYKNDVFLQHVFIQHYKMRPWCSKSAHWEFGPTDPHNMSVYVALTCPEILHVWLHQSAPHLHVIFPIYALNFMLLQPFIAIQHKCYAGPRIT